jgi:hypothetical protein
LKNTKISIFGSISKFHLWADFGKIWVVLGNFGLIWAEFVALTVIDSKPKARLKFQNSITLKP